MNQRIKQTKDLSTAGEINTGEHEAIGLIKNGVKMLVNIIMRDIIREIRSQTDASLPGGGFA
ncbi:MAG TPA: hypothetical protein G4O18_02445 [Dehalococcoidia bacterium]|nr:hypothetical protein [Dehalococcoidia bacterium]